MEHNLPTMSKGFVYKGKFSPSFEMTLLHLQIEKLSLKVKNEKQEDTVIFSNAPSSHNYPRN